MLVTSAGRRNQLIDCFRESAVRLGLELHVVAVDIQPELSPACHAADARYKVPRCNDGTYVSSLLEICRQESVQLLVPTIDTELNVLSQHKNDFSAAGVHIAISSPDVVRIAGDKIETARVLALAGVAAPRTMTLEDYQAHPSRLAWPLIAKPASGSASIGIVRPDNPEQLMRLNARGYLVQECLLGPEYTVNIFVDASGKLRSAVPHLRLEVRSGEVSKGRTVRVPVLLEAAARIVAALPGAHGPLCFQGMVAEDGSYGVFEINARFGGGYPLTHRAGARFSQWILEEALGMEPSAHDNWRAGVTMLRFDDAVFIDG